MSNLYECIEWLWLCPGELCGVGIFDGGGIINSIVVGITGNDGVGIVGTTIAGTDGAAIVGIDGAGIDGAGIVGIDGAGIDGTFIVGADGAAIVGIDDAGIDGTSIVGADSSGVVAAGIVNSVVVVSVVIVSVVVVSGVVASVGIFGECFLLLLLEWCLFLFLDFRLNELLSFLFEDLLLLDFLECLWWEIDLDGLFEKSESESSTSSSCFLLCNRLEYLDRWLWCGFLSLLEW